MFRFLALLVFFVTPACFAGFLGNKVGAERISTNNPTSALGTAVVGPGVEFRLSAPLSIDGIDFSDNQISFFAACNCGITFVSLTFNGFRFYDSANNLSDIIGVSINAASNLAGFDGSRISFDADQIFVNLQGLNFNGTGFGPTLPPTNLILDVQFADTQVPEPTTMGLLFVGLVALGAARRWRRA